MQLPDPDLDGRYTDQQIDDIEAMMIAEYGAPNVTRYPPEDQITRIVIVGTGGSGELDLKMVVV